ncbi:MAG TPA: TetR/AcrR family transcriptional regulator [Acidimicrobiales bacterium]
MMVSTRMTASERRTAVLAAAITEFARSGYAGTSTDAIASRAGISQPYLFRLFGTKKELFIATYELVSDRIIAAMTRAGTGLDGAAARDAMGAAYSELLQDPELLQVQLHGFAAAPGDPDIAATCRKTFEVLWHLIHERTGITDEEILQFFSMGMMMNVMSAIDLLSMSDRWAQSFCPTPDKITAIRAASQAIKDLRIAELDKTEEVPA